MDIFTNLSFEFLKKIILFSFWYDYSYITFLSVPIINKNIIMKYITHY